jgi:hypothetical protein
MGMRRFSSMIWISLMLAGLAIPATAQAQVICTGNASPPPELPVYDQPPIPGPGYIWTPGYWGGGPSGYFWVPGTWVQPPAVGLLWTPGYWGWRDGIYVWNAGYWGPHIGFYGGINYGFGYGGVGYEGGRWANGVFAYNRTVNNFGGVTITNVYEKTVVVAPGASRVSFNGGSGGIMLKATVEEEAATHEQHVAAIPAQLEQERTAGNNRSLLASENRGQPPIAATTKPGEFTGKGVVAARTVEPGMPTTTKPAGAATINPGSTAPGTLEKKEMTGRSEPPLKGETPLKPTNTETKPLNTEAKLPNNGKPEPLNTQSKPLTTEGKPLNTESKLPNPGKPAPLSTEAKPPSTEAKLPNNNGKFEQLNTGMRPPNTEAKLPNGGKPEPLNTGAKPQTAMPPKASNQQPQVTGSNARKPAPNPKDKKPPPG